MKIFHGKGASRGIVIARVHILHHEEPILDESRIEDVEREIEKYRIALLSAKAELSELYSRTLASAGEDSARIFEIHGMLLDDEDLNREIIHMIRNNGIRAELAVSRVSRSFADRFASVENPYIAERAADILDVSSRLISCLLGASAKHGLPFGKAIVCALDLSPSETASFERDRLLGFITAHGTYSSHTAILARNIGIPAVVGAGEKLLRTIKEGDTVILNGESGEVILHPDAEAIEQANRAIRREESSRAEREALRGKKSITKNGKQIELCANIGSLDDLYAVKQNDAEGIGLFRSEFIYLSSDSLPSEEEQLAVYRKVLSHMEGKRVIIRTLDIGADKQLPALCRPPEENPALGLRAIRLCLSEKELFRTQLRALLRASTEGRLGIMLPMITNLFEIEETKRLLLEIQEDLEREGLPFSQNIELGIMIETPAAAIISDKLAPHVDFFSIGTNDLTQYTLACDRQSPVLEPFCDPHHEAVLRLIKHTVENAHAHGKWVGICGELAADLSLCALFLAYGVDELSVSPNTILELRDAVRKTDLTKK